MKLYKVHFYQAYRADECETVWLAQIPENNEYYYSEVLETKEVELPEGVTYDQEFNSFSCYGKDCDLVTEGDGTVSLVSEDGIMNWF